MSSFKLRKEKDCLNCGEHVEKHFCPACGQENIEVKEDAFHMVAHAVADYFHFEHKFFATLKPLLLKPGKLTQAYVAGKRVSFIHPIRLYIFISIIFFLVVLSGQAEKKDSIIKKKESTTATNGRTSIVKPNQPLTEKQLKKIAALKEGMKYVPGDSLKKDSILQLAISDIKTKGKTDINIYDGSRIQKKGWFKEMLAKDSTVAVYEKRQAALPADKRDGFLKHYIVKRGIELSKYQDPQQKFVEDLLHNVPKMMFLLLPLFALILKIVYIRKKKYYYEHLIYSFHVHSAMFLAILITILFTWITSYIFPSLANWLSFLCIVYIIWYIYRSLRTFYNSTRWVTVLKLFFLFVCYNIVLTLCFLTIIAVSFAMI